MLKYVKQTSKPVALNTQLMIMILFFIASHFATPVMVMTNAHEPSQVKYSFFTYIYHPFSVTQKEKILERVRTGTLGLY